MTDPDPDRGPADLQHPRFARAYARAVEGMNSRGATEHRRALLHGLSGRVVEIGAGDGSNFGHYPATVTEVLAVEPDDYLRSLAGARASSAPVPVRVVTGTAEDIPAADGSADAVVARLVLCSVSDQSVALAEARRVLRPGGVLAFYEHVRSDRKGLAALEDLLTPCGAGRRAAATRTGTRWDRSRRPASKSGTASASGSRSSRWCRRLRISSATRFPRLQLITTADRDR